ncbi:hypothetical protein BsWGS_13553 [Bradybaena similaris]
MEVPVINIEQHTSSSDESSDESLDEKKEEDVTDTSDEGEEEEYVEEEEVDREMTSEEKKAMYEAVKSGDTDTLEECLDHPNSDINMTWYKENLLMAAIRHGQEEVAEFLLDNGVDYTYSTGVMELRETRGGIRIDRYDLTCRQMAYDWGLLNIVQLIDLLDGNVFPFVHPPERTPRQRRPKESALSGEEDDSDDSDDNFSDTASGSNSDGSVQSSKKNKDKKNKETEGENEALRFYLGQTKAEGTFMQVDKEDMHAREHGVKKLVKKKEQSWNINDTHENEAQESDMSRHKMGTVNVDLLYSSLLSNRMKSHSQFSAGGLYYHQEPISNPTGEVILNKLPSSNDKHEPKATFGQSDTQETEADDLSQLNLGVLAQPINRIYSSKSALALIKANSSRSMFSHPQANIQNRPLKWRKVTTAGSYTAESRHWHTNTTQTQESLEEVTKMASSAATPRKHSVHQISSPSRPNCLPKQSTGNVLPCVDGGIKSLLSKNNSTTTSKSSSFIRDHDRPVKKIKRRISPRFMNSYEVLDFIPDSRQSTSSASGSSKLNQELGHRHLSLI